MRNTYLGSWGGDERGGGIPFAKKARFYMTIMIEEDCFRVFTIPYSLCEQALFVHNSVLIANRA